MSLNKPKNIIIFGSGSEIIRKVISQLLKNNNLLLFTRNVKSLRDEYKGYKNINIFFFDCKVLSSYKDCLKISRKIFKNIDIVIFSQGIIKSVKGYDLSNDLIYRESFEVNFFSIIKLLDIFTPVFLNQNYGKFVTLSSVASFRGKSSNYLYGSTKSALNHYLVGYSQKLGKSNINLLTFNLGPVSTLGTKRIYNKNSFLLADLDKTGSFITKSIFKDNGFIVYPYRWNILIFIFKLIPYYIYTKLLKF